MNKKGVTLVELLIVIVVMGIISGIAVFTVDTIVQNTRQKVDRGNLASLNTATQRLIEWGDVDGDAFEGINSDYYRMEYLSEQGYIDQVVIAQQRDTDFRWNVDNQIWELYEGGNPYNDLSGGYDFSGMTLQDAYDDGAAAVKSSSINYNANTGTVVFGSAKAILVKPAGTDTYSYTVTWSSENTSDPRPLFIFDYNDASDLSKGEGWTILIRVNRNDTRLQQISNGTKYVNKKIVSYANTGIIPNYADNPNWAMSTHTTTIKVTRINASTKHVEIFVDGVFLQEFDYAQSAITNTIYYGFGNKKNGNDLSAYNIS